MDDIISQSSISTSNPYVYLKDKPLFSNKFWRNMFYFVMLVLIITFVTTINEKFITGPPERIWIVAHKDELNKVLSAYIADTFDTEEAMIIFGACKNRFVGPVIFNKFGMYCYLNRNDVVDGPDKWANQLESIRPDLDRLLPVIVEEQHKPEVLI